MRQGFARNFWKGTRAAVCATCVAVAMAGVPAMAQELPFDNAPASSDASASPPGKAVPSAPDSLQATPGDSPVVDTLRASRSGEPSTAGTQPAIAGESPATSSGENPATAGEKSATSSGDNPALNGAAHSGENPASPAGAQPASVDTLARSPSALDSAVSEIALPKSVKTVLYLGGGARSPWYHLGVLYAVEAYAVPVDSVVGTSWGAYIGALWAKGVSPDDIQRILLDVDMAHVFGPPEKNEQASMRLPVSESGLPSLRERFSLRVDSSGNVHRTTRPLSPDSSRIGYALARLRLQESLLRHKEGFRIPFAALGCDGALGNSFEEIYQSVPVQGNETSGELCPYLSLPLEDSAEELAIISVSDPVRGEVAGPAWYRVVVKSALNNLSTQPGVIVRPHTVQDSSYKGLIQAGFSAMESKVSQISSAVRQPRDYASIRVPSVPWFKFKPIYDSLPPEMHNPVKSYWSDSDTGLVAPRNFAYGFSRFPACDSLSFDMLSDGDMLVDASVLPTFDVALGGFGSNAFGPNAYAELSFYYIDQMEIMLSLSGFYGGRSFGFSPRLKVDRLWSKDWGLSLGFNWMRLRPDESFLEDILPARRFYSEQKSDIEMSFYYKFDSRQTVSVDFLFADRTYELDAKVYGDEKFEVYPASQKIRYGLVTGDTSSWFPLQGLAAHAEMGLTSIGYDFGFDERIPTFITMNADIRYAISPKPFVTISGLAEFGMDKYHKDGFGYVYPESFALPVLNNSVRQRILATPWSSEWVTPELLSHQYGLIRLQGGLHYRGSGIWITGAYVRDFEENPLATLGKHRFVLEPALRLVYKSINAYAGLSRTVDNDALKDLKDFGDYEFFIRIGNYDLF